MEEKVLFVEPAKSYPLDKDGHPTLPNRETISLSALMILGSLKEKGIGTDFMDLSAEGYSYQEILNKYILRVGLPDEAVVQRISETKPSALLISSMFSTEQERIVNPLITAVRKAYSELPIIVGGQHATLKPDWLLETGNIDYVVYGEGEETIRELLRELKSNNSKNIRGIAYRKNGIVIKTEPRPRMQDINRTWALEKILYKEKGELRYKKYSKRHYLYMHNVQSKDNLKGFALYYSRGCPMACDHCTVSIIDGRKVRHMGSKRMFTDIKYLHETIGINVFSNQTDTFGLHPEDIKFFKIMKKYRKQHPDIILNNPNAFFAKLFFDKSKKDQVNEDLIKLYADAGFNVMTIAVESFNPKFVKKIDFEYITPYGINRLFSMFHDYGMKTELYMMFGFPEQTKEELIKDEKIVENFSDIDVVSWNQCMVFPGTPHYQKGLNKGWFDEKSYRNVIRKEGLFLTHIPEELNLSQIPEYELTAFRKRHPYPF